MRKVIITSFLVFVLIPGSLSAQGLPAKKSSDKSTTSTPLHQNSGPVSKAATNSANALMNAALALDHHADILKKNIEAFTRRGIDADKERSSLENDQAKLVKEKEQIIPLMSEAASLDASKNQSDFKAYRMKLRGAHSDLKAILVDMKSIISELREKMKALEDKSQEENVQIPAGERGQINIKK